MSPDPLNNLDKLKGGFNKRWIWKDTESYNRSCDYLQKINYCIQDINHELECLSHPSMKEVIYLIVLIDWIKEAVNALPSLLRDGLTKRFSFQRQSDLSRAEKYFTAIRSFVVAHPLSTNRHEQYGFDGTKICVDIRRAEERFLPLLNDDSWKHIDLDGLHKGKGNTPSDIVLIIYDKNKAEMEFFECIGASSADVFIVAELLLEKLYSLDKYLNDLKKKDWV